MFNALEDMQNIRSVLAIVAHPDDETLWCGGELLARAGSELHVVALCRKHDPDRAPRFERALRAYGASGRLGDLDDGPEQRPLGLDAVEATVLDLIPTDKFDLLVTHHPQGEYRRHRRHEECARAVALLWSRGRVHARRLWTFAYDNEQPTLLSRARRDADRLVTLAPDVLRKKRSIIREIYGFSAESWEARTVPEVEAFLCFDDPSILKRRSYLFAGQ